MKITITATDKITTIDGVSVRLWEGVTEQGTLCQVFVHLISARTDANPEDLDRELKELPPPREVALANILGLQAL